MPYNWNGQDYSVAGIYSITLTSSSGCDSIATLDLIVTQETASNTIAGTCDNQLPYSWNGNTYISSGNYSVTLTNAAGCDSIATLQLTVNPVSTSNTDLTVCTTQLPYTWNGNSYSTTGTYSVTLTSAAGCDSIATLHLSANPTVTSTTPANICDNQVPYTWNGNSYAATGTYSVTLTGSGGCDSIATLQLTINPVVTSTTSFTVCNDQLPYSWNGQNYSTPGLHSVTLVSAAGCDSIATLNLIINQSTSSNTIESTCENQLPYSWNGNSYTSGGSYSVTLTNAAGCDSVATLLLTVNPLTSSTTNASVCSAQLPFVWNGQNFTTAGTHVVTLTNSAGCDSIATLNLTINQTPPAPVVNSPVVYCEHDTTSALSASITTTNGHLVWYTTSTNGTGSLTAPVPSSENAGVTNYFVSQVDGPCEGPRAMITVTINDKPDLGPDKLIRICFGQSADLVPLFNVSGNWTFDQQPVTDPSHITVAGTYQLIVQNNFGCADTALANLSIQPPVIANAGNDADAETNVPYQLSGSGGGSYQWSPETVLNNPYIANPYATLTESTTFILMVKDEIGCIALDTVKIRVLNGPTFYVPTAFTPNGDGLNDIFKPTPVGIAKLDFFRVFNRYGELVYETHDIGKGWDGTYKGIKQNIGNYVWSVSGTDRTGKLKVLKGNVVLIR
nr:hypothetical protein [uncultured bacterium]